MEYSREKMGALLVRIGLITEEQLDVALAKQAESGGKLGEVLARDLVVTEDQIAEALAQQKGLLHVNLASVEIDRGAVVLLPWRMARLRGVIPIGFAGGRLMLAMSDPLDVEAIDETELRTGYKVDPVVASASQVLVCHREVLRRLGDPSSARAVRRWGNRGARGFRTGGDRGRCPGRPHRQPVAPRGSGRSCQRRPFRT